MLKFLYLEKLPTTAIILFYLIFFINLVIDDGINWSLNYILLGTFLTLASLYKKIYINRWIALTLLIPFSTIYIVNFIFHSNQISSDPFFNNNIAPEVNSQFLYILPFLTLPTVLLILNNSEKIFIKILNFSIIVSVCFNIYFNLIYELNRGLLSQKFGAIILYDASIASLSLLTLIVNFYYKTKYTNLFIILAITNLFLIIAHGSRGTWLGVPFILIIIAYYFFKTQRPQVILTLCTSLLFTIILFFAPNSPFHERWNALKQDTALIEQNSYHSSTGTRIFLWKYSIDQFLDSPVYGVGTKAFRDNICKQQQKGTIPACNPHAHNIFFQFLATHGLLGLIGILTAFIIPLGFYFHSLIKSSDEKVKTLAFMGVCFTLFFSICGLTDFLFFTAFPTMFYFLTTVTLMTFISKRLILKIPE